MFPSCSFLGRIAESVKPPPAPPPNRGTPTGSGTPGRSVTPRLWCLTLAISAAAGGLCPSPGARERFVINEFIERPAPEIVAAFKELLRYDSVTCAISDCMGRFNAMTSDMRPLFDGIRLVGTAVTVKTIASDLAAAFKAIDVCQPGDIVVIDSHGSINTAFWGENMTMSALNRGVVAAVIDGACRDVEEIRRLRFPVICKGIVPNVGAVAGYGDVNVPIQCAGVAVSPGDVVVVDGNGVVVVPKVEAAAILDKAQRLLQTEHVLQEKIKAGATIGELVDIDEVFKRTFSYQEKAVGETDSQADRGSAAS